MNHLEPIDAAMAEGRAVLNAAWLRAEAAGDQAEMTRLSDLATEIDRFRAQIALDGLEEATRPFQPNRPDGKAVEVPAPGVPEGPANSPKPPRTPAGPATAPVSWAGVTNDRHGPAFREKVVAIAARIGCDPSHLMAVMAFETGETFSPSIVNAAGSGAVGLIQFMPRTARSLGTTADALGSMTAIEQLDWVERYFAQFGRRALPRLSDVYMTVLWPAAVGKSDDYGIFRVGTRAYAQNRGLDRNGNGTVTKGEATAQVARALARGLAPGRVG